MAQISTSAKHIERRHHLPVMSECDVECRLCGPLGCLRPARLTDPEFLRELDAAALRCATTVVFPPNFLNHPEASHFCAEVSRRGLRVLVRIRPAQLISMRELLNTLEYHSASFEVVVSEAVPKAALASRLSFKTVLVPSRTVDPSLLYDSLPLSWRTGLEVLAPLPSVYAEALSADELYLFLSSRSLRPYSEFSRSVLGRIPGAASAIIYKTGNSDDIRLSCVLAVNASDTLEDLTSRLENLAAQSLETRFFEICLVADRISNSTLEGLLSWSHRRHTLAIQIHRLADCWGEPSTRLSQAFNLAATSARGSRLLFLSAAFPIDRDLLSRCAQRAESALLLDSRSFERPSHRALLLSTRHYFDIAGFSESLEHRGFEFDFVGWKSVHAGLSWSEWVLGEIDQMDTPVSATSPKYSLVRARSAQEFFISTLDLNLYRSLYVLMGSHHRLRRLFQFVMSWSLVHTTSALVSSLKARAHAARVRSAMRLSMKSLRRSS